MRKNSGNFQKLQRITIAGFSIIFFIIIGFLFRWQIWMTSEFQSFASQRFTEKSTSSLRGEITTRNDETLAYSDPAWDVFVYIPELENAEKSTSLRPSLQSRNEFLEKVSSVSGIDQGELAKILSSGPKWVKIKDKVNFDEKTNLEHIVRNYFVDLVSRKFSTNREFAICITQKVASHSEGELDTKSCGKLDASIGDELHKKVENFVKTNISVAFVSGLNFEFTSKRVYPEGKLAAHVLGFIGKDLNSNDIGREGLEQKYDGTLEPQEGFVAQETDKFGNPIAFSDSIYIRAKRGNKIKTTIDKQIQSILERKLCEGMERYQAKSASGIVLDPKTGEVLAIANCPNYDPNKYFEEKTSDVFTNKAIVVPYEVGSIAKLFTMSAAIEELGITPDEIIINGHNGCREIHASNTDSNDIRIICTADKMAKGPLTATQALIDSDNLAFVNLSERLGKENLYNYLTAFGVGEPSGIDLSGESIGYLPKLDDPHAWHPVDMAVFSFGHGYQMNLMQATKGIAAIANNGVLMQPYVVSEIIDDEGKVKKFEPIALRKVISEDTADTVITMMEAHFHDNAKLGFPQLLKYPVATKSGTALIGFSDKVGYSSDVNATYVGFDTSENRRFIMAIKLESPQAVQKLSFYSTRVIWMETYDELKDYLGIAPIEE